MTRTYATAIWLAILFVAVTETQVEMRHYEQRAMQMEFRTVIESMRENKGKVAALSDWGREARHAADQVERVSQYLVVALAIAGVAGAFHTSGVWWILMGGSIFAAGRAGYQAAQAMGVL